ncbi:MAG TPA: glycoside hydrolase family 3 N-terminal domain-containing protein [Polyangia bacterium]|nr:glycoside hydrolase family 3 N-terminal domain-containing protein [Polyangia bacterium]
MVALVSSVALSIVCSSAGKQSGTPGSGGSGANSGTGGTGRIDAGDIRIDLGSGNVAGSLGTGTVDAAVDAGTGRTFPSQGCLDKAAALLAKMSGDEKLAQLQQVERANTSAADITAYDVGSVYSQGGSGPSTNSPTGWADMIDGFRSASFKSHQGIPIIYGLDVVHGVGPVKGATVFPHNIGLGATRDPALVEQVASVVADEAAGVGADFPFAPVVAVARDERWGRTYEAFGETTELATAMGVAYTNGFQKRSGPFTVLANAKHYIGDGGTMNGVNTGSTSGDEATLRALFLPPYQAAVNAGVGSIMASYSTWQGTRMHANKTMLTDVLKGDLGFQGFVGSDYNACTPQNGVDLGTCLNAGVDMAMTFGPTASSFLSMVRPLVPNTVPQSRIDDAARRILVVKCEMGLLDGAQRMVDRTLTAQVGSAAHRAVARKAVAASLVVLKNDGGVLPLSKDIPGVALGGKTADNIGNQCGGWTVTWQGMSGNVTTGGTTVKQALEGVLSTSRVSYALDGSATGNGAPVGIAVIGETPYSEGCGDIPSPQGGSNCVNRPTTLEVDSADVAVVQKMKNAGLKTVVVLVTGRPLLLDQIIPIADAIVVAWLPGTEGAGVTDVLFGDVHPTGKLPRTWPRDSSQIPMNVGDPNYDPLFPYAYGLTY